MKIVAIVTGAFLLGGAAGAVTTSLTGHTDKSGAYCAAPVAEQQPSQDNPWKRSGASQTAYNYRFARSAGVMVPGL